ncbi:MAG: hypothetical protein AB4368_24460 [Xenococcaceae cyanobacterium]
MVQLKGKDLAMFEPQSPKLPVGSTFIASIEQSKSALILHVKPESVRLSKSELPKQSKRRQEVNTTKFQTKPQQKKLKRKFYLDIPLTVPIDREGNGNIPVKKKKRNFSLDIKIPDSTVEESQSQKKTKTQPAIKQLLSRTVSIVLHQSIKSQYQKMGKERLKIDTYGEWSATIKGHNCQVYNRHKKLVFQSNLVTDYIAKHLTEANAKQFTLMCERETKNENLTPKKVNRLKRKPKQNELSME